MKDYKNVYNGLMRHIEDKVKGKYCDLLEDDDLHYMSKFVATVPFESTKEYLSQDTITSADGETVTGESLRFFIKIVCGLPVSQYLYCKSVRDSFFGSAMPYFLYCHKLHNQTSYMSWKNHPFIKLFLGRHLSKLPELTNIQIRAILEYKLDDLMRFRTLAITRAGVPQPVTSWNMVQTKQDMVFDSIPKCIRLMLLQSWALNVVSRNKYMILDPLDWDFMPEALDESVIETHTQERLPRIEDMI